MKFNLLKEINKLDTEFDKILAKSDYTYKIKKNFNKRKYGNNPQVIKAVKEIIKLIVSGTPPSDIQIYSNHELKGKSQGKYHAHLVGTKITMVYSVDNDKQINLYHLGTHPSNKLFKQL